MMHAFVDFSQTLSSRHIKLRISLTSLKGIFIINYCLETAVFKFNCLFPVYKSISCSTRGINEKYWGPVYYMYFVFPFFFKECDIFPPTYFRGLIKIIQNIYQFKKWKKGVVK